MAQQDGSGQGQSVAVFGAAGHTGRFTVEELLRRGFAPVAIGRDGTKLAGTGFLERGVPIRTASIIDDPTSLDRALSDVVAVINCAGPFLDTADAVATAALRARIHYLDVTAEQASAQATFMRFEGSARQAGVVFVPAMGFYGGLADLLASASMDDWSSADEMQIGYALDSWWPTQGTRRTGQRNMVPRLAIVEGTLVPVGQPAPEKGWDFPLPFGRQDVTEVPFSETVVIARHLRVSNLHTYLNNTALRDIRDPSTPPPVPADDQGRSAQSFLAELIVRNGSETRRASAQGRDIYAFTAPLVVEAVQRIIDGVAPGGGVFAPGEVFDARDFLQALAPEHLAFDIRAD